jgi:hypothetical protein
MAANQAFEIDLAWVAELDVEHPLDCIPNRIADEDLATTGVSRYSRRHRNVAPEQVVSTPEQGAHMDADSHPDGPPAVRLFVQGPLHLDTAEHGLTRIAKGDHKSVALIFHHIAAVVVDELAYEFVVPLKHCHPSSITQRLVLFGGTLDVGEDDHDVAVGGQFGEIGTFDLGPASKVLDRVSDSGTDALFINESAVCQAVLTAKGAAPRRRRRRGLSFRLR